MRTLIGSFTPALLACSCSAPTVSAPLVVIDAFVPDAATDAPVTELVGPEPYKEIHSFPAQGLTELPKGFVLDGAIGEWEDSVDIKFALTKDGLTIAGKLMKEVPQAETITVLFQFGSRPLPTVGVPLRGGGVFELDCETTWDGQPMAEPEAMHCQGMMAAATQFREAWEADSRSTWLIGPKGVTTPKGASIAGATSFVKKGAEITFEAQLPLEALPLAIEAPVTSATAFITTELRDPNPTERNAVGVIFGDGVRFGASTDLRHRALEEWGLGLMDGVPAVAYRLGNDTTWIVGQRASGWLSYERTEVPVMSKRTTHKSFDVGTLYTGVDRIVTIQDNKVVGLESAITGEVMGDRRRPPGLHVFAVDSYRDEVGQTIANWTVYVIDADGQITGNPLESPVNGWQSVEPFHSKDFGSFGFVGRPANSDAPGEVRVTYSYVAAAKSYEPKVTGFD